MNVWATDGLMTIVELDITCESSRNIIKAKQNDMSRHLRLDIKNGDDYLWTAADQADISNDTLTLRVERADGTLVEIEQAIEWGTYDDELCILEQTVKLTAESLGVAGRAYCDAFLTWRVNYGTSGEYDEMSISTEPFYIDVEAMPTDISTGDVGYGAYNETQFDTASISVTEVTT